MVLRKSHLVDIRFCPKIKIDKVQRRNGTAFEKENKRNSTDSIVCIPATTSPSSTATTTFSGENTTTR